MKAFSVAALLMGLVVTALLILRFGVGAVAAALLNVGLGGFFVILAAHFAIAALCGVAWWLLLPPFGRPAARRIIWARLVRNGATDLLPASQAGGFLIGMRIAVVSGVRSGLAAASIVVDLTMELFGQLVFAGSALAIFVALRPQSGLAAPVTVGLAIAGAIAALWFIGQRQSFGFSKHFAAIVARRWAIAAASGISSLRTAVNEIYHRPRAIKLSFGLHLLGWMAGAAETWLALWLMGAPLAFGPVFAIEGLVCAARGAAFVVPGGMGVQEGVYVILGGLFGLGSEVALALSLLKRARDLCLGLPPLVAWQFSEAGRLWSRSPGPQPVRVGDE